MKHIYAFFIFLMVVWFTPATFSQVDLTSTGGIQSASYPNLKIAFDSVNAGTHTGVITIGISASTTETASAVLNASGTGSAFYASLTITPTGGGARTISGSVAGYLIDLNGADYVTINGLNSGGNSLTISNTATGASGAVRLINDASNNTITNCSLKGSASVAGNGVLFFSTGAMTGNNNNMVSNCAVGPAGTNLPVNGIYSYGLSNAIPNSGNTISGNNVYDFFSASLATSGIFIEQNNNAWTVTGNRLYQTATRTYTTANTHIALYVNNDGNGFTITGNVIGYATSTGTGTYTMAGTVATRFIGLSVGGGGGVPATSIQGNTITAIKLNTSSGASTFYGVLCGIRVTGLKRYNIGNVTSNVIGGTTGTGLLNAIPTTTQGMIVGINSQSSDTVIIQNNIMGGFLSAGTTASVAGGIMGITVSNYPARLIITGNTIGNSTALNMVGGVSGTTTGSSLVSGIYISQAPDSCTISNNTIQNLASYGSGTAGYVRGIWTIYATGYTVPFQITGNNISNLISNSAMTTITNGQGAAIGINTATGTAGTISGNTISGISLTNTGTGGYVNSGITLTLSGNMTVSGNKIYNLSNASTSVTAATPGLAVGVMIYSAGTGNVNILNNMITLGAGQTTNTCFVGIQANHGGSPFPNVDKIYFNTVSISGAVTSGGHPSFCFLRGNLSTASKTMAVDIKNNVFQNGRTGGTGVHCAISNNYGATTVSATGWSAGASDYNVLNASASTVGYWTTAKTFADWKTVSSGDSHSYSGISITFADPTNCDLHLNMGITPTYLESWGTAIAGVNTDFDGQVRPGPAGSANGCAFAPDLGADEFDGVMLDLTPPVISYTPLLNTASTSARTLTASITDPFQYGVPISGTGLPVVYWRINHGTYTWTQSTSTGIGQYSFTFGSGAAPGDTVYYYVTAQDLYTTPNVAANPSAGTSGFTSNPPASLTPPTSPNYYTIAQPMCGTYYVGINQTYSTLTAAITDFNAREMSCPVTLVLKDPTYPSETFPIVINPNNGSSAINTLTIKPDELITTVLSGSVDGGALIKVLNNYTIIDGCNSPGGTTRNLTITNTSIVTPYALHLGSDILNPLTGCTVKNTILSNGITNGSAILISNGTVPDNPGYFTNISIQNNKIQLAGTGITCNAVETAGNGNGIVITDNELNSPGANALRQTGINLLGISGANISDNQIGNMTSAVAEVSRGIWLNTGTMGVTVHNNIISGIANTSTGTQGGPQGISITPARSAVDISVTGNTVTGLSSAMNLSGVESGIYVGLATSGVTISGNIISNIKNSYGSPSGNGGGNGVGIAGILLNSTLNPANVRVDNNVIYDVAANGEGNSVTSMNNAYGIAVKAGGGYGIYYNSVRMNTDQAWYSSYPACLMINTSITTPGSLDIRNNIFSNEMTTVDSRFTVIYGGVNATNAIFTAIDHNDYYTTGNSLAYFGSPVTDLEAWRAVTGQDVMSVSVDPVFASSSDLRLDFSSTLFTLATPVAGITEDILGAARNSFNPTIGAYENGTDARGPVFSYTPLGNTTLWWNRTLDVTITDHSGVPVSGAGLPVLYWKINAGIWNSVTGVYLGDSKYQFTFGSGVTEGDIVSYYMVAQDNYTPVPWVSCDPSPGALMLAANPPSAGIPPASPNNYTIVPKIAGTKTIGTGGDLPSITGPGGLFALINESGLVGNVTALIISDLNETAENGLVQWSEDPPMSNFTLTIKPVNAIERIIYSSAPKNMIRVIGGDRLNIDGRYNGVGNYLRFRSMNSSTATFQFSGDASYDTVQYCYIEGSNSSSTSGVVLFGTSAGSTGSNHITLMRNIISDRWDVVGLPVNLVYSAGTAGSENDHLTFHRNEFVNFNGAGIRIAPTGNGDGMVISENSFYQKSTRSANLYGIYLAAGSDHLIEGNSFGGSQADRWGAMMSTTGSFGICGIYLEVGNTHATSVQGNILSNFGASGTFYQASVCGLNIVSGDVNVGTVTGNTFGGKALPHDTISGKNIIYGIRTQSPGVVRIENNLIGNIAYYQGNTDGLFGIKIESGTSNLTIRNNTIRDIKSNSTSPNMLNIPAAITFDFNSPVVNNVIIEENLIQNIGSTASLIGKVAGINVYGIVTNIVIRNNRIFNIYSNGSGLSNTFPELRGIYSRAAGSMVYNNLISIGSGSSAESRIAGIEDAGSGVNSYYFNNINITGTGVNPGYGFLKSGPAQTTVKNNIFCNARIGVSNNAYAIAATNTANLLSDNNDLYSATTPLGLWGNIDQNDLASWRTASGGDANSVTADPAYTSATDLHSVVPALNNGGEAVSNVTLDFDSIIRSNPPDIGAFEFILPVASIQTLPAGNIEPTTAILNAEINTNNEFVDMTFEYGHTVAYGNSVAAIPAVARSQTALPLHGPLTGLMSNSTYHFRIKGLTATGVTVTGDDMIFQTLAEYCETPSSLVASLITGISATLSWSAPQLEPSLGYEYEVRTSGEPGSGSTGLITAGTAVAGVAVAQITGLSNGTSYLAYVRSRCSNEDVSEWTIPTGFTTVSTNINVSGIITNGQSNCYNATNTIVVAGSGSAFVVQDGGSATFIAGSKISFLPGTTVQAGGYMHGYISNDGLYCSGPVIPLVANLVKSGQPETFANLPVEDHSTVKIYPNPVTENLTIDLTGWSGQGQVTMEIYNGNGLKVMEKELKGDRKTTVTVQSLLPGLYILQIRDSVTRKSVRLVKF